MSQKTFSGAVVKSGILHIVVVVLLMLSFDFSSTPEMPMTVSQPVINATVVDKAVIEQKFKKIEDNKKAEAQRKRSEELAKQQREKERKQKIEDDRRAQEKAKQARIKKEQDKKKAAELEKERQRKEQEERKKREEIARQKQEQERKEAERKKQLAKEQAEQQRMMEEQLQAEMASRQRARSSQVLSEVQKYKALIYNTIQRNLIVDDSMNGKKCRLNIRLASNGFVTNVSVLGGDGIVCDAARRAVLKSETLPVSSDPDIYQQLRDINLTVEPEL
ncbi:cell envelope integrity protein TolA [Neptunicella sp. SCSIO 80796]|uniref:cell envelope integrity protein TolA n=1 Tax=Neptunicella plasticusilytica TaxID=3117012 RepID=UPI003A4E502E